MDTVEPRNNQGGNTALLSKVVTLLCSLRGIPHLVVCERRCEKAFRLFACRRHGRLPFEVALS